MCEEPTFICMDCGIPVFQFVELHANDNPVCLQCKWIRDLPTEEERKKAREFLNKT